MTKLSSFNSLADNEKAHIQAKAEEAVEGMSCISSWMSEEVTNGLKELLAGLFIQSKTKITQLRKESEDARKNVSSTPEYKALEKERDALMTAETNAQKKIRQLENNITEYQAELEDKETEFEFVYDIASLLDEKFGTQVSITPEKYAAASVYAMLCEIIPNVDTSRMNFTTNGSLMLHA